jgi:hypothetical protein
VSDIATVAADSLKVLDPKRPIREEKREPVSDIATVAADSLKVLDPKRPIREADMRLVSQSLSPQQPRAGKLSEAPSFRGPSRALAVFYQLLFPST